MQQWFEKDQPLDQSIKKFGKLIGETPESTTTMPILKTFFVGAETKPGQSVCVSGNCPTLGNWEVKNAFVLTKTNDTYTTNK